MRGDGVAMCTLVGVGKALHSQHRLSRDSGLIADYWRRWNNMLLGKLVDYEQKEFFVNRNITAFQRSGKNRQNGT